MKTNGFESKRKIELLSRTEAADYLRIAPHTLAVWQCTGRYNLPCVKIGKLAKYRKEDLDNFILSRTTGLVRKEVTA
jgi:predicted site-specific integrase-resolvase